MLLHVKRGSTARLKKFVLGFTILGVRSSMMLRFGPLQRLRMGLLLLLLSRPFCSATGSQAPEMFYQTQGAFQNATHSHRIKDHLVLGEMFLIAEQTDDDQYSTQFFKLPLATANDDEKVESPIVDMTVHRIYPGSSSSSFLVQAIVNGWERIASFNVDTLQVTSLNEDIVSSSDIPFWIDCVEAIPTDGADFEKTLYGIFGRYVEQDSIVGVVASSSSSNESWERRDLKFNGIGACPRILPDDSILSLNTTEDGDKTIVKLSLKNGSKLAESPIPWTWMGQPLSITEDYVLFLPTTNNSMTGCVDMSLVKLDTASLQVMDTMSFPDDGITWSVGEYNPILSMDGRYLYLFALGDRTSQHVGMYNISGRSPELVWREEASLPRASGVARGLQSNQYLTNDGTRLLVLESTGLVVRDAFTGRQVSRISFFELGKDRIWYRLELSVTPDEETILLSYGLETWLTSEVVAVPFPSETATTGSPTGNPTTETVSDTTSGKSHPSTKWIVALLGPAVVVAVLQMLAEY